MSCWTGKHVLVIGLGVSGLAAASFLLARGAIVTGIDSNLKIIETHLEIVKLCSQGLYLSSSLPIGEVEKFDSVVVSPGIPPSNPYYAKALALGIEVIGEVELIAREISKRCIGVTGTNGKTTVTLLITHILSSVGIKAMSVGNIGTSLNACLESDADVFVVELSSFQLETLKTPFLDAALLLNITPDHLDRYESMEAYALAKVSIERGLKPKAPLFVEKKCLVNYELLFQGNNHRPHLALDNPFAYLQSFHDIENTLAAFSACSVFGVSLNEFEQGLKTFRKPPHRIEFVCTHSNIDYYDDSKGTNIDAVISAVRSMNGPVVLIAGGVDKGFPYHSWIEAFNGKVRSIYAIGEAAPKMKLELGEAIPVMLCSSLEEAVKSASLLATPGDKVLLSPGCASFDMFNDYAHRGKEFQRIVHTVCGSYAAEGQGDSK